MKKDIPGSVSFVPRLTHFNRGLKLSEMSRMVKSEWASSTVDSF